MLVVSYTTVSALTTSQMADGGNICCCRLASRASYLNSRPCLRFHRVTCPPRGWSEGSGSCL